MSNQGWIGFDLDGTLATYDYWRGVEHIGEPIEPMVNRLKMYLKEGHTVKIMTARANEDGAIPHIQAWCKEHIGTVLPITTQKDYGMIRLYDDRAVAVEHNTGKFFSFDQHSIWK